MSKNSAKKELEVKLTSSINTILASYNNKEAQEKIKKLVKSSAKSIGKKFAKILNKAKPAKKSQTAAKSRKMVSKEKK